MNYSQIFVKNNIRPHKKGNIQIFNNLNICQVVY